MLLRPNPSSGIPVYVQLVEQVRHAVETGALRAGERLPAIRPLAEDLVISPGVVARAYRELEETGVISPGAQVLLASARELAEQPDRRGNAHRGAGTGIEARLSALALENHRLAAQVAADAVEREKRNRELDRARQVQERLFPQEYPAIASLDYAGVSRPALGVGGDYYDFIPLSATTLGMAIGDVSGKGIPAGLLMATLRASLRSQALQSAADPAEVVANLNRLVYESSSADRYATFFYARYDSTTRVLEYVNAGHLWPFVLQSRGGCRTSVRLETTGPAIGVMPGCSYTCRRLTLSAGDVFVAFTDGISEAMNAGEEEWGEERLAALIESNSTLSARDLSALIMREADEFVGGAPQYDDMTLVTARLTC